MKTIQLFFFILSIGLFTTNLSAQSKAEAIATIKKFEGEWILNRETVVMESFDPGEPVPYLKWDCKMEGDTLRFYQFIKKEQSDDWADEGTSMLYYDESEGKVVFQADSQVVGASNVVDEKSIKIAAYQPNGSKMGEILFSFDVAKQLNMKFINYMKEDGTSSEDALGHMQMTFDKQ